MLERVLDARDALLTSPRFRRWAMAFPLTRPIARRRATALFNLMAGFVYTQTLSACVALDLFTHLSKGPVAEDALARMLPLPPKSLRVLLEAAAALNLVTWRDDDRVALGALGAAMVGDPGLSAMVRHHRMLYVDLTDPLALLRGDLGSSQLAQYWAYARAESPAALPAAAVADYSALMAASQPMIAAQVLEAVSLRGSTHLMDVGGGEGAFLSAAAAHAPHLRLTLVDLPSVAARARSRLEHNGFAERIMVVDSDMLRAPLPVGADVISLVRVVHDHDDAQALKILQQAHTALPKKGRLILAEPMAGTPGAEAMGAAYFGLYLHAMGSGRPRTARALGALLRAAGFRKIRRRRTAMPLLAGVLEARA